MDFKLVTDQTECRVGFSRKETARKILSEIKPDIIVIHEPFVPSIGHTIISSADKATRGKHAIIVGQFHARREDFNWTLKIAEFLARHIIRRPQLSKKTVLSLSSGYVSTINDNLQGRIAVSKATEKFWQAKLASNYKIIYNGINTEKLTINGSKIKSWMGNKKKIILFAGRHDPRKGLEDLINALNILVQNDHKNIRLKIAGKGEMTEILQKMVEKLNLKNYVQFVGVLPYYLLIKAYRTADLVVAPSTGGEGFNRTIIEARSCGTLVVCTDIDGQNEAIGKDLAPFMAKPKNPHSLAKQILIVLNLSKEEKKKIREHSAEEVRSLFNWNKIAKEHIYYYKSLIDKHK